MIVRLETMLNRPLTAKEKSYIDWLQGLDRETIDTFNGIFEDLYKRSEESK